MTDLDRLDALAAGLQKALAIGAISYDGDPWYAKDAGYDYDDARTALEVAPQMLDSLVAAVRERDELRAALTDMTGAYHLERRHEGSYRRCQHPRCQNARLLLEGRRRQYETAAPGVFDGASNALHREDGA